MRLAPPVPSLLPREILQGGLEICGEHFPAGTVVGVPAYTLHHNPAYYPEPFSYKPERWMVADGSDGGMNGKGGDAILQTADAVKTAQSAYCPFSIGPRGCIGKGVAYLELSIALAENAVAL